MGENEKHIEGWKNVAKLFPMISEETVRKKYGKEMLSGGWAFKTLRGKHKSPRIWAYPSIVKQFIAKKQIDQGYV